MATDVGHETMCEWTPDVYGDLYPQCHTLDIPLDIYIVEHGFRYCPFCGNKIKVKEESLELW